MPPCVQYDDLWPGGPRFARSGAGFALGTDSVLLADFAADRRVRRFADLGCGAGVLTVLLLHALPQAAAVGVELQPEQSRGQRPDRPGADPLRRPARAPRGAPGRQL